MLWTEERVERLTELWHAGWTASTIAAHLGGTSRCAVIGKVHRLGLAGRAVTSRKTPSPSALKRRRAQRKRYQEFDPDLRHYNRIGGHAALIRDKQRQAAMAAIAADRTCAQTSPDLDVPEAERIGLADLPDNNCKWPFGDKDFYFHRAERVSGLPYCEFHANKAYNAYQPTGARLWPPSTPKELTNMRIVYPEFDETKEPV